MTQVIRKNKTIPRPPVGWPLLPVPGKGTLTWPGLEESIKAYIKILILTRPGEQLMRPWFGLGLSEFLHQPNTLETRRQIQFRIMEGLSQYEHRIITDRVEVWEEDGPDTIGIEIAYRIKRTNDPATVKLNLNLGA